MNLGQKIKNLRVEKMMTQKELAGGEITRNMLSQIENGLAQPSLATIVHLAHKLGVPAGYLLSEGDEEFIYNKTGAMKNIKRAYADKNFELCRDMCLSSFDEYDDELELILTDSCLGLGMECAVNGRLYKACRLLDEAWTHADKTMYSTTAQRNVIKVIFGLLKEISPTLDSYEVDTDDIGDISNPILFDGVFAKYATVVLNDEKHAHISDRTFGAYTAAYDYDELLISHLSVKKLMIEGNFKEARRLILQITDGAVTPPRLLLYLTCCDMEICCREEDDYKGAYEFAGNRLEILEHMLIDE